MKIILLLSIFITAVVAKRSKCHSCFMGVCYQRSKLFGGRVITAEGQNTEYQITGQLAIDRVDNIVYFHYVKNDKDYTGAYDLNNDFAYTLPGIEFSFARAVDEKGNLYMSGFKGIYKYTKSSNSTTEMPGFSGSTIWHMQFTDKLYYNIHFEAGLTVLDKKPSPIAALMDYKIEDFVVDKYGDIYFLSDTTMYRLKHDAKKAETFAFQIYTMSTDRNGNIYFAHTPTSGLYKLDYATDTIVSVGAFGGNGGTPLKFAFDNINNVVYLDEDQGLYWLIPTYRGCKVTSNNTGKRRMLSVTATGNWVEP